MSGTERLPSLRRLALVAIATLVSLALPTMAHAASGPWQSVDVTLIGAQSGRPSLLVAGKLPANTALPAKVALAIPAGARIGWAGEILGGDTSKDPAVKYTVTSGSGYDLVTFTLTKSSVGQIEVDAPGAYKPNGATTQAALSLTAPFDIPTVHLFVQLPSGAQVASGTPGGTTVSKTSESMFTRTLTGVKAGDTLSLAADYSGGKTPATTGAPAPATTPPTRPSPLLIGIVGVAVLAAILLLIWRLSSRSADENELVGDDSYEDTPQEPESPAEDGEETSVQSQASAVPPARSTRESRRPRRKSGQ